MGGTVLAGRFAGKSTLTTIFAGLVFVVVADMVRKIAVAFAQGLGGLDPREVLLASYDRENFLSVRHGGEHYL